MEKKRRGEKSSGKRKKTAQGIPFKEKNIMQREVRGKIFNSEIGNSRNGGESHGLGPRHSRKRGD